MESSLKGKSPMKHPLVMVALVCLWITVSFYTASSANATEEDPFPILREERIGDLHIGMSEDRVKQGVACPLKRGKESHSPATGEYVEEWAYSKCGLWLVMSSERRKGKKEINSIRITGPSKLPTKRGIRIGSTEQEVVDAYAGAQDQDALYFSKKGKQFVAGSIYGGLIFSFTKGRVSEIFLGAGAE
jgi:hypothetical protein